MILRARSPFVQRGAWLEAPAGHGDLPGASARNTSMGFGAGTAQRLTAVLGP